MEQDGLEAEQRETKEESAGIGEHCEGGVET